MSPTTPPVANSIPSRGVSPSVDIRVVRTEEFSVGATISVEVWNRVMVFHSHVEDRGCWRCLGRGEPAPVSRWLSALGSFALDEIHVSFAFAVMVRHPNPCFLIGMQYRLIQCQECMIFPEGVRPLRIHAKTACHDSRRHYEDPDGHGVVGCVLDRIRGSISCALQMSGRD
jgi:hypothetical protein